MGRTIVFGAGGCVGRHLAKIIKENSNFEMIANGEWIFLDHHIDLTDTNKVQHIFEFYKPKYVINLAAKVPRGDIPDVTVFENNMMIDHNILHFCHTYKVKRVVMLSSVLLFSGCDKEYITIEDLYASQPDIRKIGYASSKMVLHHSVNVYRASGLDVITLIPTGIFGPYDNFNDTHLIASLIKKFMDPTTGVIDLHLNPTDVKQFVYSGDLANIIRRIIKDGSDQKDIIIPGVSVEIGNLTEILIDLCTVKGINWRVSTSTKRIYRSNVFFETSNITKCLRETVEVYRDIVNSKIEAVIASN